MTAFIKSLEIDVEKARADTSNARQQLRTIEAKVQAYEEREHALADTLTKARNLGTTRKLPARATRVRTAVAPPDKEEA